VQALALAQLYAVQAERAVALAECALAARAEARAVLSESHLSHGAAVQERRAVPAWPQQVLEQAWARQQAWQLQHAALVLAQELRRRALRCW
jgi:hypothetical protein